MNPKSLCIGEERFLLSTHNADLGGLRGREVNTKASFGFAEARPFLLVLRAPQASVPEPWCMVVSSTGGE